MKNRVLCLLAALAMLFTLPAQALGIWKCAEDGHLNHGLTCAACGKYRSAVQQLPTHPGVQVPNVGEYVTFGHYEQDNDLTDGDEAIEWQILEISDGKALLLSRYGLDAKPYNTASRNITWADSSLRKWLNNDFLEAAFTEEERGQIQTTKVNNSKAQGYTVDSVSGGNDTRDQIFLLSYAEANKYFALSAGSCVGARVQPTAYAIAQGAYTSTHDQTWDGAAAGRWWLRSFGYDQ